MAFYVPGEMKSDKAVNFTKKQGGNNNVPDLNSFGSLNSSEELKKKAEKAAADSNGAFSADDAKYGMAVELANSRLGGFDNVDDAKRKEMIDSIYENELGAETSGHDYRGENIATDIIGTMKDGINGFNRTIGDGMDFVFDNTIGNIAGLFGMGDDVKNAFNGEDLSIIPDAIEDIAIGAIPFAGIPLVVAKNAIQQSDNIAEALSGVDNVTRQSLDPSQQLGKGTTAALTTGLSALPGVGKVAAKSKYLEGATDTVDKALREGVIWEGSFPKRLERAKDSFTKNIKKADDADSLKESMKQASKKYDDMVSEVDNLKLNGKNVPEETMDELKALRVADIEARRDYGLAKRHPVKAVTSSINSLLDDGLHAQLSKEAAKTPYEKLYKRGPLKGMEKISSKTNGFIPQMTKDWGLNMATAIPVATASAMGEYGGSPIDALANAVSNNDMGTTGLLMTLPMPGTKKISKKSYSPGGRTKSSMPMAFARGAAIGNWGEEEAENYVNKDYALDEAGILKALKVKGE